MMGAVTIGLWSSHASATSAGLLFPHLALRFIGANLGQIRFGALLQIGIGAAAGFGFLQHAAEHAAIQRTPRNEAEAVGATGGDHFQLDRAFAQVVQALLGT